MKHAHHKRPNQGTIRPIMGTNYKNHGATNDTTSERARYGATARIPRSR